VRAYDFSTETAQRAMDHAYDKGNVVPARLNMPCVTRSYGLKRYKAREGRAGTWWNQVPPKPTHTPNTFETSLSSSFSSFGYC
jgi:hypothetical protein